MIPLDVILQIAVVIVYILTASNITITAYRDDNTHHTIQPMMPITSRRVRRRTNTL